MAAKMILVSVLSLLALCLTVQGANVGEVCAVPGDCPANAGCINDPLVCVCNADFAASEDSTACVAAAAEAEAEGEGEAEAEAETGKMVGGACTVAGDCPNNANCTASVCTCKDEFEPSDDNKMCNGATALQVSLMVVMAAIAASKLW